MPWCASVRPSDQASPGRRPQASEEIAQVRSAGSEAQAKLLKTHRHALRVLAGESACPTNAGLSWPFAARRALTTGREAYDTTVARHDSRGLLNGVTDPPAEPSAEPEAFRLPAPQRGLTATEHQARHARTDANRSGRTTRSKAQAGRPTTQGGPRPPVRSGRKPYFRICQTSTGSPAEPGDFSTD